MSRPFFFCVVLLALLSFPAPSSIPKDRIHTIANGETLSLLAKRYYGATWKYSYLLAANQMQVDEPIKVGQRLKLPDVRWHRVRRGESLSLLAKQYYGRGELYPVIRWANRLTPKSSIKIGQQLRMPFLLKHKVRQGDRLKDIALRYYRDEKMVGEIVKWNKLSRDNLLRSQPYIWLAVREGLKAAEAVKKIQVPKSMDLSSMILIREWLRQGKYAEALKGLQKIPRTEFRTREQQADYHWNLMQCQVALGRRDAAMEALRAYFVVAAEEAEDLVQQSSELSPKVRHLIAELLQQRQTN